MENYSDLPFLHIFILNHYLGYNYVNEVISLKNEEKNEVDQEEEEKQYLLELMKMQNEALKRIYKNTLDHEKKE